MIQIIMLICGIGVAFRLPKLLRRTAADYPGVDPAKFEEWHRADIRSAIAFLIASWGVLLIQIGLLVTAGILAAVLGIDARLVTGVAQVGGFVLFLIGLVVAGTLGSKAARLKKEAGAFPGGVR